MWGSKKQATTFANRPEPHRATLDLIEQVTALRGQVRSLEAEWDDMRAQIRKGYLRMEKAYERSQEAPCEEKPSENQVGNPDIDPAARTFAEKYKMIRG